VLGTITPLGERARSHKYWRTVTAYIVASAVGGAIVGGTLAWLVDSVWSVGEFGRLLVIAGGAIAAALLDGQVLHLALPTPKRQVDDRWIRKYRGWAYGAGFGLQLGGGLFTRVVSASVYATFLAAAMSGTGLGVLVGGSFGLVRGTTVLLAADAIGPEVLGRVGLQMTRLEGASRRMVLAVEVVVGLAAVTLMVT
jgi:hypothetical protein